MPLLSTNNESIASMPTTQEIGPSLEGDQITQEHKLQVICILSFLNQYPISEGYFKKCARESRYHWSSIFQVNNMWNHLKFTRFLQKLVNLSLGSWTTCRSEAFFQFRANAQEFRYSTFAPDQQRDGVIMAIRLLSNYVRTIPKALWVTTTNISVIGHIKVCLIAEANLIEDTELVLRTNESNY